MAKFTNAVKATLKGYFNAGDQPTEGQFAEWFDRIQEGIDEHDHSGAAGGDGLADLTLDTADFSGHVAIGNNAGISANIAAYIDDIYTGNAGFLYALAFRTRLRPTGAFTTTGYGISGYANLETAQVGASILQGVDGAVQVIPGVAGTILQARGGYFTCYANNGTITDARSLQSNTPYVTTGSIVTGTGLRILQGTVGAGSITNLYGINISSINAGTILNYAIYTNVGQVRFGDNVFIDGSGAADHQLRVQGAAAQTGDLQRWENSAAAVFSRINKDGYFMTRKTTAPANGDLVASELAFWFDDTNGNAFAMFKGKTANGTVVTGSVALA